MPVTPHDRTGEPTRVGALLARARRDDPTALDELLGGYRNYLKLLARTGIDASLQGKADPSDVAQEALLKSFRNFGQFRGRTDAELAAWLRTILAHTLADLGRTYRGAEARNVARERSLEDLLGASSLALGRLLAGEGSSPSQQAQRRELAVVLADVLAELDADRREVLVLRSLQERPWDEVARRMGRSEGAARILWARTLKDLRPLMEKRL
jgi:RNA polymerase sigma-70 factor (ECF subfamily)